jgi:hypothetical protein
MSPSQLNYIRVTFPPIIVSPSPTHQAVTALRPKSKRRGFICTATFAASRGAIDRARPPSSATTHDYVVVPGVSAAPMHPVTETSLRYYQSNSPPSTSPRACTGIILRAAKQTSTFTVRFRSEYRAPTLASAFPPQHINLSKRHCKRISYPPFPSIHFPPNHCFPNTTGCNRPCGEGLSHGALHKSTATGVRVALVTNRGMHARDKCSCFLTSHRADMTAGPQAPPHLSSKIAVRICRYYFLAPPTTGWHVRLLTGSHRQGSAAIISNNSRLRRRPERIGSADASSYGKPSLRCYQSNSHQHFTARMYRYVLRTTKPTSTFAVRFRSNTKLPLSLSPLLYYMQPGASFQ